LVDPHHVRQFKRFTADWRKHRQQLENLDKNSAVVAFMRVLNLVREKIKIVIMELSNAHRVLHSFVFWQNTKPKQAIKAVPPATKTALFNHAGVG